MAAVENIQWRHFPHVAIEAEKRAGPIDRFLSRLSLAAAAFDHRRSKRRTQLCTRARTRPAPPLPRHRHHCTAVLLSDRWFIAFFPLAKYKMYTVHRLYHTPHYNRLNVRLFFYLFTIVPPASNLCSCTQHTHTHTTEL